MFTPNYENIVNAAYNRPSERIPIYEHSISDKIMEAILGREFRGLFGGGRRDKEEYLRNYCEFFKYMGYDAVSFERCIGPAMPDSGLLGGHGESVIHTYEDFEKYPWDEIPDIYFNKFSEDFEALRAVMPEGMKAVGGVGNGIFECVQDITGYMNLALISADDPELYRALYRKIGEISQIFYRKI
jgi:uroporphyrinogen decarboxylase